MTTGRPRLARMVPLAAGAGVVVVVIAVVVVVGVYHAVRLDRRLQSLPAMLQSAETQARDGRLGQARVTLASAESTLASTDSSLYSGLDFDLLDALPVARQNLATARAAVSVGLQLVGGAEQVLAAAGPLENAGGHLQVHLTGGRVPLATIQSIEAAVSALADALPTTGRAPGGRLVSSRVQRAADRVYTEAAAQRRHLGAMADGLGLLAQLAGGGGEHTTLLAVANTAEMRGAGGMVLSYGVLSGAAGQVSLERFGPIDQLALSAPAPGATFPADFLASYRGQAPTEQWREATLYPDFRVDGPVLAAMYRAATRHPADAVVQIDPAGLAAILDATGPLQVPGVGTVTAGNVVGLTLNQLYVADPSRPVRQEYLATVAQAAFAKLTTDPLVDLGPLASGLGVAVTERHIVAYAADPATEASIAALGADGGLPGPGRPFADLTVQNIGGDKMDWYLASALAVSGTRPSTRPAPVHLTVTLHDTAPAGGLPPYIFGPFGSGTDPPGTYRGLVTVYLPRYTTLAGGAAAPTTTPPIFGTQGGMTAVTWTVDIPAGATSTVSIDVVMPPFPAGSRPFEVVPTPRIDPTATFVSLQP